MYEWITSYTLSSSNDQPPVQHIHDMYNIANIALELKPRSGKGKGGREGGRKGGRKGGREGGREGGRGEEEERRKGRKGRRRRRKRKREEEERGGVCQSNEMQVQACAYHQQTLQ